MATSNWLKIRFPSANEFFAAQKEEVAGLATPVLNAERRLMSVVVPQQDLELEGFNRTLELLRGIYGVEITEDFQFDLDSSAIFNPETFGDDKDGAPSLQQVLEMIHAPEAWHESRGRGVTIAIVDTGINGARPEFPPARRSAIGWAPAGQSAWEDSNGHGTMCATIAAASRDGGGQFEGVAPEATIMSCRSSLHANELTEIYDLLRDRARAGEIIVASNSWGVETGLPPVAASADLIDAISQAIDAGVFVVFSAGNNHLLAGGVPGDCAPNSIWTQYKCREDALTVANCKLDRTIWDTSSRGPGEFRGTAGTDQKPDVTAPTPEDGRILYGNRIRTLPSGWGTSGACAQVSGLAALLRSKRAGASRTALQNAIQTTASNLGLSHDCSGHGLIHCGDAIAAI
jgi:serine protease AprX